MQRILITGGAGFIGSHLAETLIEEDYEILIVDNLDHYYNPNLKRRNISLLIDKRNVHFHEADILRPDLLTPIFSDNCPDVIIHLAALPGVLPSMKSPQKYYRMNVQGTLNMLDLARQYNVKRFIFGSSSSVYGKCKRVPFKETTDNITPISPYGHSKLLAEEKCRMYAQQTGMTICCLRFFTVYGERQRPDMAIYKFIRSLYFDEPITLYGDGSTYRDYTYVNDIVTGIWGDRKLFH